MSTNEVIELDLSSDDDAPPSTPPRAATAGARANPPTSESDDSEIQYVGTRKAPPAVGANPPTAAAAQQPNNNNNNKKSKISVKGQTPDFSNNPPDRFNENYGVEDLTGHLYKLSTDQKKNEDASRWSESSSSEDEALRARKPPARPVDVPPAAAARRRIAGDESSVSSMEQDEMIFRQGREEESSEEEEEEEEAGRKPAAANRKTAARVLPWLVDGEESSDDEGAPRVSFYLSVSVCIDIISEMFVSHMLHYLFRYVEVVQCRRDLLWVVHVDLHNVPMVIVVVQHPLFLQHIHHVNPWVPRLVQRAILVSKK